MAYGIYVKDKTGSNSGAKVAQTGPNNEEALWVHLAGSTAKLSLPVFNSPIAGAQDFDQFLENGGSNDMAVDGSVTAVDFRVEADPVLDTVVTQFFMKGTDGSIKMVNWFANNNPLTNGVLISYKNDNQTSAFPVLQATDDFVGFSTGDNDVYSEQSSTTVLSFRNLTPPLIIRAQGAHGTDPDDYFSVLVQDDLTGMDKYTAQLRGFTVPAGTF